jgi:hypothetical protein
MFQWILNRWMTKHKITLKQFAKISGYGYLSDAGRMKVIYHIGITSIISLIHSRFCAAGKTMSNKRTTPYLSPLEIMIGQ